MIYGASASLLLAIENERNVLRENVNLNRSVVKFRFSSLCFIALAFLIKQLK